jgi:hypothetical protein
MPKELIDTKPLRQVLTSATTRFPDIGKHCRDTSVSTAEYDRRGKEFFQALYGDTADDVQGLLDTIMPDMGWFCNTGAPPDDFAGPRGLTVAELVAYGCIYGFLDITDQLETSYALVGTLITGDTPLQITWHLNNARRGGATLEQARAAREIAIDVAKSTGVVWKNQIPEVN